MFKFLHARFNGSRFDSHALPYELLPDLHAYATLIEKLAEHLYKQRTGKKRINKEFKELFGLKLSAIKEGSASAVLEREPPANYTEDDANGDDYSIARNMVNEILQKVNMGEENPISDDFPEHLIHYFDRFGKGMKTGEYILLSTDENFDKNTYQYSPDTRISLLGTRKSEYKTACNVSGKIDTLSVSKNNCKLITTDDNEIKVALSDAFQQKFRDLHHETETYDVRIYGLAIYNRNDIVVSIDAVQHITIYNGADVNSIPSISDRITEIKSLEDSWSQDGEGYKFDPADLDSIQHVFSELLNEEYPAPYLYPTPDNEISAEWSLGHWELSMVFELDEKRLVFQAINLISKESINKEISYESIKTTNGDIKEFLARFFPCNDERQV